MKRVTKVVLAATAATVVAGGTVAALPSAEAANGAGTVATVGYSLAVNSQPRTGTRVSWLRPGERITIECQVDGQAVDGRWGRTTLWNKVPGRGFVSDGWIDTGTNGRLAGVPDCNARTTATKKRQVARVGKGVIATGGVPLSVNPQPRLNVARTGWAQPGERIDIECQVQGDWGDGRWGRTNLWDRIPGRGYVSDGWVDTGTNGRLKGVPTCTDAPARPTTAPRPTTPPQPRQGYQYPFTGQFYLPFANGASYPITQGPFSSDPSWSHSAANATLGPYNKHAIDFGTPVGTRLLATGPGVIRTAGWDNYGYGYKVVIDHGNDRCTVMGHLSRVDVKAGDRVVVGDQVGLSGNTGNSTGPHLHWGVVRCSNGLSLEIPRTVENGTSYGVGAIATSRNPGR
ncbi:hypothetical protein GCM10027418_30570 [Mariniluteicoccus endophyticus]